MNPELQGTLEEFARTLDEVEILLTSAETCVSEEAKYAAYTKSALLLLSGKFESFAEAVAEEYVYLVNTLGLRSDYIPDALRLHHTYAILDKVEQHRNNKQVGEIKKIMKQIGAIWVLDSVFNDLDVECKFTYGKHGEKELRKLFVPLGIEDVFEQIQVCLSDENISDGTQVRQVDFRGTFNSVTNIRNNILHQDASPNLTHESVREYKLIFQTFAREITMFLDRSLGALKTPADSKSDIDDRTPETLA